MLLINKCIYVKNKKIYIFKINPYKITDLIIKQFNVQNIHKDNNMYILKLFITSLIIRDKL